MWKPKLGVCSWSLQVDSIPDLVRLTREVGAEVVQIGLGDPNHGTWKEGPRFIQALEDSGLELSGTMIGYAGEDYTTPATIQRTGGFGDPATRAERLEIFKAAVEQTAELGLRILCSHAGFIPEPGAPERGPFLETLREAGDYAHARGVIFAMETGQETAKLLRTTIDELACPGLKVNFDPANMILYDMGDPVDAVRILGSDIVHVHAKDAKVTTRKGEWGSEVPLGEGDVDLEAFVKALDAVGYRGPLVVEREVGDQSARVRDIRKGVDVLRRIVG
ncbi:MAG TPA: sugar phosphate isomerase/epimerase family protein [Planctomycetota bacterium]|nr:sugar phosphate isomerase/epimerase family protein [Planctomycetota bacterium]